MSHPQLSQPQSTLTFCANLHTATSTLTRLFSIFIPLKKKLQNVKLDYTARAHKYFKYV